MVYLSSIVTENIGEVVQLELENLLGGLGLGTGRVNERGNGWVTTLSIGVGPPEALGSTGVELGY